MTQPTLEDLATTWEDLELPSKKPRAPQQRLAPNLSEKVLSAFDKGHTPAEIAAHYGTTPAAIRDRIRRSGRSIRVHVCSQCGYVDKGETK